jgi:hypothetical protein
MAKSMCYAVGDRVECRDDVEDYTFYGTIIGQNKKSRSYDVKREDGQAGFGIKKSWRIYLDNTEYGGQIVRRRPALQKAA